MRLVTRGDLDGLTAAVLITVMEPVDEILSGLFGLAVGMEPSDQFDTELEFDITRIGSLRHPVTQTLDFRQGPKTQEFEISPHQLI